MEFCTFIVERNKLINSNEISFREIVTYTIIIPTLTIGLVVFAGYVGSAKYDEPVKCKGSKYVWTDKAKSSEQLAQRWFPHRNPSVVAPQIEALNKPSWQLQDSVKIPSSC